MKPVFLPATLVNGKSVRFILFYRTEMRLVLIAVETTSSCGCASQLWTSVLFPACQLASHNKTPSALSNSERPKNGANSGVTYTQLKKRSQFGFVSHTGSSFRKNREFVR